MGFSPATKRVIFPADVAIIQKKRLNKRRVVCSGPDEWRTRLEVSKKEFPELPDIVERYPPLHGLAIPVPRSEHYFA